jgi:3-deoxy-7-phosphoheptulonate synthase
MPTCTGAPLDARFHGLAAWAKKFAQLADRIGEALDFMEGLRHRSETTPAARDRASTPATRRCCSLRAGADPRDSLTGGDWYDTSATCCGSATARAFDGSAHVEFLRGIGNPIGMKCGPSLEPDALLRLLDVLNP